jgi:hypothetical protein
MDEAGRRTRVQLAAAGHGRYEAKVRAAMPGRMDFLVVAEPILPEIMRRDQDEHVVQSEVVTVQVDRPDLELLNVRSDPQWLARVAQATGGRLLKVDEIDDWRLDAAPRTVKRIEQIGLWHHPLLITLFFVLLCAEWILRRLRRLA